MVGGTAKYHLRRIFTTHPLLQHLHQTRFADARLAAEHYHLSHALFDLCPAFQE